MSADCVAAGGKAATKISVRKLNAAEFQADGSEPPPTSSSKRRRNASRGGGGCCRSCVSCVKATVAFMFSHIGLSLLVACYTMGGAHLFLYLERNHSIQLNDNHSQMVQTASLKMRSNVTEPVQLLMATVHRDYQQLTATLTEMMANTSRRLESVSKVLRREAQHQQRLMDQINAGKARMKERLSSATRLHKAALSSEAAALRNGSCACGSLGNSSSSGGANVGAALEADLDAAIGRLCGSADALINSSLEDSELLQVSVANLTRLQARLANACNAALNEMARSNATLRSATDATVFSMHGGDIDSLLSNFTISLDFWIRNTEEMVYNHSREGWIRPNHTGSVDSDPTLWTFPGAVLFAISVVTTIGYGHVAPKTLQGKMATIVFSIFGIPLMMLCLANVGSFLASILRLIYRVSCLSWLRACERRRAAKRQQPESGVDASGKAAAEAAEAGGTEAEALAGDDATAADEALRTTVPLLMPLAIFVGYVILGAVFFAEWENWEPASAVYFVFITLSTIGFGDMVPGMHDFAWNNQAKPIVCAVYLLFGLSLIAMCFDLMQERVRAQVRWFAGKIGLLDKA